MGPRSNVFTGASFSRERDPKGHRAIPCDNAKRRHKLACNPTKAPGTRRTLRAKDLSPDQKTAIERLLGRFIAENEEIRIRATTSPSVPEWLQASWKSAQEQGPDQLSVKETDAEIAAARKARRGRRPSEQ